MNRHGVRPGRVHIHLSSTPTGFLVGGFVAADTRVPLPADAGVSLGPDRPHQRQTRRGGNRNMLARGNSACGKRIGCTPSLGRPRHRARVRLERGSNMAPLACPTEMNDAMVSNIATSTC